MRKRNLATVVVALAFSVVSPCLADVITLQGGRKLVGTIRDPEADPVRIKTQFGEESVPRSNIVSITLGPTPWEEFETRMQAVDARSLPELEALLDWAGEAERAPHLRQQLRRLYRMIVRLDPDHEEARRGLGFVRLEGEWVTREAARRRQKADEAQRAAEEAERRAEQEKLDFLRRAEGDVGLQMGLNLDRDKRDAEILGKGIGVKIDKYTSHRISVAGHFDREAARALLELGENALTTVGRELGEGEQFNPGRAGARGVFHQFFVRPEQRKAMIDYYRTSLASLSQEFYAHLMRGGMSGISCSAARPYAMAIERPGIDRADTMLHQIGHCVVGSLSAGQAVPPWLQEGYGMYMSIRFTGNTRVSCTTITQYAHELDVAKRGESGTWALLVREQVTKKVYPRFHVLCNKHLNRLDGMDLARSWIICKFLMDKHPKRFRNFLRYSGATLEAQQRALEAALEWTFDQLDDEVNRFILDDMK